MVKKLIRSKVKHKVLTAEFIINVQNEHSLLQTHPSTYMNNCITYISSSCLTCKGVVLSKKWCSKSLSYYQFLLVCQYVKCSHRKKSRRVWCDLSGRCSLPQSIHEPGEWWSRFVFIAWLKWENGEALRHAEVQFVSRSCMYMPQGCKHQ